MRGWPLTLPQATFLGVKPPLELELALELLDPPELDVVLPDVLLALDELVPEVPEVELALLDTGSPLDVDGSPDVPGSPDETAPLVPELLEADSAGAPVMSVAVAPPQAMARPRAEITRGAIRRMAMTPDPISYPRTAKLATLERDESAVNHTILPTLSPLAHRLVGNAEDRMLRATPPCPRNLS